MSIFSHELLFNCLLVCKSWKAILDRPSFWSAIIYHMTGERTSIADPKSHLKQALQKYLHLILFKEGKMDILPVLPKQILFHDPYVFQHYSGLPMTFYDCNQQIISIDPNHPIPNHIFIFPKKWSKLETDIHYVVTCGTQLPNDRLSFIQFHSRLHRLLYSRAKRKAEFVEFSKEQQNKKISLQ